MRQPELLRAEHPPEPWFPTSLEALQLVHRALRLRPLFGHHARRQLEGKFLVCIMSSSYSSSPRVIRTPRARRSRQTFDNLISKSALLLPSPSAVTDGGEEGGGVGEVDKV